MPQTLSTHGPRIALLIVGILTLGAVIIVAFNLGKINAFAEQAARAQPAWLLLAAASQIATYFCTAIVWRVVLLEIHEGKSLFELFPLAIAKLFADQALPSGGVSGALFFLHALGQRGVPQPQAVSTFTFTTIGFFAAFLSAVVIGLVALSVIGGGVTALAIGAAVFFALITTLVLLLTLVTYFHPVFVRSWLLRIPGMKKAIDLTSIAIRQIVSNPRLIAKATAIQFSVRMLDGLTLMVVFLAIGENYGYSACFIGVVIGSLTATLGPIPMGLGTFEAGMVAALTVFGVPVESALTATLLYRGLSLWLPLVPGFFIIQREFLQPQLISHDHSENE